MKFSKFNPDELSTLKYLNNLYSNILATEDLTKSEEAEYFFLIENITFRITKLEDDAA